MASSHASSEHGEEHELHISSIGFNAQVLAALLFLTGLTYWTATLDLGALDTPVALIIAFTKTSLVILYFMHVRWSSGYVKVLSISGFAFLVLLFGFTFSDLMTRMPEHPWGADNKYTWPGASHRVGWTADVPEGIEAAAASHDESHGSSSHAKPGHAKPGHAKPGHAKPTHHTKPSAGEDHGSAHGADSHAPKGGGHH